MKTCTKNINIPISLAAKKRGEKRTRKRGKGEAKARETKDQLRKYTQKQFNERTPARRRRRQNNKQKSLSRESPVAATVSHRYQIPIDFYLTFAAVVPW